MAKCQNCGKELSFLEFGNEYCRSCLANIEANEEKAKYYRQQRRKLRDEE
jgi:hypothetical protein